MGWGYGHNNEGREIGYSVQANCDEPGCKKDIDRGLSYVCGGMHDGNDIGCGKYFCGEHLFMGSCFSDDGAQLCGICNDKWFSDPDHQKEFNKWNEGEEEAEMEE